MYLRTIKPKNKDGPVVEYIQIATHIWNKENGFAKAKVIHSFGRSERLDFIKALRHLKSRVSRFFGPESAIRIERKNDNLRFISIRPVGGA